MEYTPKEILGLGRHQVIHLVETGIIKPLKDVRGRGRVRKYSEHNLKQLTAVKILMDCKIPHREIGDILREWNDDIDGLIIKAKEFYRLFCCLKSRKKEEEVYETD